ncbi:hypothetical protein QBC40DRAFT_176856 [Triangularia verruculosa]|uniref:Ricin B lectin domain-containing protein n=1 Tax=Triangularia verruculosa TaxID=2587418 RepID=A0AAN7AU28_9PEZI|nr:hypothetical protein QBC40DRAFT_176856 [Triangularia verruculosa]
MFSTSVLVLALAATGLAQVAVPEGYRKVYITSAVDTKFVIVPKAPLPAKAGNGIKNDKPEQHWYLKDGPGVWIQLADTNLCLDAGAKSNWKDMGTITLKECSATEPAQKWNVMADGRIALEDSPKPQHEAVADSWTEQCIDLVYMRATPNNAVGLYTCAGLGNTGAKDKGINWPLVNATLP